MNLGNIPKIKCAVCLEPNTYLVAEEDYYICGNCEPLSGKQRIKVLIDGTLRRLSKKWGF